MPETTETCTHPADERIQHDFGPNGYLNVPKGVRTMCSGCGADLGPSAAAVRKALAALQAEMQSPAFFAALMADES